VSVRFWSKVDKNGPTVPHMETACWVWRNRLSFGYGTLRMLGMSWWAHRLAWTLANGPIPPALRVLHRCDNRACVRPDHLFLGTQSDNMRDMVKKGRNSARVRPDRVVRGEAHGCAKFTEQDVRNIRAFVAAGLSQSEVARRYGRSLSTVNAIIHRRLWRSLA